MSVIVRTAFIQPNEIINTTILVLHHTNRNPARCIMNVGPITLLGLYALCNPCECRGVLFGMDFVQDLKLLFIIFILKQASIAYNR